MAGEHPDQAGEAGLLDTKILFLAPLGPDGYCPFFHRRTFKRTASSGPAGKSGNRLRTRFL
jgi:hypothetical protein